MATEWEEFKLQPWNREIKGLHDHHFIWWFPEIGLPRVIIHFNLVLSIINPPFWGFPYGPMATAIVGNCLWLLAPSSGSNGGPRCLPPDLRVHRTPKISGNLGNMMKWQISISHHLSIKWDHSKWLESSKYIYIYICIISVYDYTFIDYNTDTSIRVSCMSRLEKNNISGWNEINLDEIQVEDAASSSHFMPF